MLERISNLRYAEDTTIFGAMEKSSRLRCTIRMRFIFCAVQYLLRVYNEDDRKPVGEERISNLRYAEDTTIFDAMEDEMVTILNKIEQEWKINIFLNLGSVISKTRDSARCN